MEDNLLLKRIREGDKESFRLLFGRLYPKLVVYAQSFTFDKEKSEDLVQDVFLYLWEHASQIKIHTSLSSYLYRMTRNRCLDYLKSLKVIDSFQVIEDLMEPVAQKDKSLREKQRAEYERILSEIETFPTRMREIFKLRYFDNRTYAEIAEALGVSLNTVKTQLKRAKDKLKDN